MDREQREIELKKIELEKAKVIEGHLRTLALVILTLGAGAGTLIQFIYPDTEMKRFLLVIVLTLLVVFTPVFIFLWFKVLRKIREVEKWI